MVQERDCRVFENWFILSIVWAVLVSEWFWSLRVSALKCKIARGSASKAPFFLCGLSRNVPRHIFLSVEGILVKGLFLGEWSVHISCRLVQHPLDSICEIWSWASNPQINNLSTFQSTAKSEKYKQEQPKYLQIKRSKKALKKQQIEQEDHLHSNPRENKT